MNSREFLVIDTVSAPDVDSKYAEDESQEQYNADHGNMHDEVSPPPGYQASTISNPRKPQNIVRTIQNKENLINGRSFRQA